MRVLTTEQHTDEWYLARKGRITASAIDKCLAGKHTKSRRNYAYQIVLDLENVDDWRDTAPWFEAGHKFEDWARGWFRFEYASVEETGFVLHDEYNWLGASPDGLIGDDATLEIKFRKSLKTYEIALTKKIPRAYLYQMQAQMFVTNRQRTAYVNYWRDEKTKREQGNVQWVERDETLIRELEDAAMLFWTNDVVPLWQARNGNRKIVFPWDAK